MSANNPHDGNLRPLLMLIALTVAGLGALAVLAFLDVGALRPSARTVLVLDAERCPDPRPGQILIVTVPPEQAGARLGGQIIESQTAQRQRALQLAAKAAE